MEDTKTAMPPKVSAAISAVMASVPKLEKTQKNQFGKYSFAGIDSFLEALRPLCADNGLIIRQNEEDFQVIETPPPKEGQAGKRWLLIRYSYTLAHASGEVCPQKDVRSIIVDASMGAQAFGAAQSYSLKQYMRSLFMVATGEKGEDADEHDPANLPQTKRPPSSASPEMREYAADAGKRIDAANNEKEIQQIMAEPEMENLKKVSMVAYDSLSKRGINRLGALSVTP